jgi:hypothetical protein
MRGAHSAAELAVVDFFPLDFEAYCRVLNPARSGFGGAMPWTKLAGPSTSVSAATQWADISSQPGLRDQPRMDPVMGGFDSETAAALAPVLLRHTQTPRRVYYLAWEGYADINDDYRASETVRASYGRNMHVLEGTVQEASSPMVKGLSGAPLWWIPADGAWCVGNDIYARSVYVGGAPSCIQEILADQELEAYPVSAWQRVVTEDY